MNAKKLPSGNYRARVLLYTDANKKKHYKSFTAPTKKQAELMALEYIQKNKKSPEEITLGEAIDKYIKMNENLLSPTTIKGYKTCRKYGFQDIMPVKVSKIDNSMLKEAVARECARETNKGLLAPKTVHNEYGLIEAVLREYGIDTHVKLPKLEKKIINLPEPEDVYEAVKGSNIELPVMLAMWLSFSMSELRGLKRSSIHNGYIQVDQVVVRVEGKDIEKKAAKVDTRIRKHRIPPYIMELIDKLPPEQEYLVPEVDGTLRGRLRKRLIDAGLEPFGFHMLRHINASAMAMLAIPDKYAQERGGWKTDATMKKVYQHTFSKERQVVDEKIDGFFNKVVNHEEGHPSYEEFLNFFRLEENEKSFSAYQNICSLF